jgi:hypothetical protein
MAGKKRNSSINEKKRGTDYELHTFAGPWQVEGSAHRRDQLADPLHREEHSTGSGDGPDVDRRRPGAK